MNLSHLPDDDLVQELLRTTQAPALGIALRTCDA